MTKAIIICTWAYPSSWCTATAFKDDLLFGYGGSWDIAATSSTFLTDGLGRTIKDILFYAI